MVLVRFNKETNVWDQIDKEDKEEFDLYLDGGLKKRLDFAKKQISRNNDVVGLISGDEGSGKSTIGANIMRYMSDDTFNPAVNMIGAEDDESVLKKIEDTPNKGALMFDEGNSYFLSTETMKKEQRDLHKLFSIFRQKNMFVLIVAPSFFRLNSYFALDRSRFHIRTRIINGTWGTFEYWGDKKKGKLYRVGKKFHDYSAVRWTIHGRFRKCHLLESEEYRAYKTKTLSDAFKSIKVRKAKKAPTEVQVKRKLVRDLLRENLDKKTKDLAPILGMSIRRIQAIKKELLEESNGVVPQL